MDDTTKMLRAIMNGQTAMKQELKDEIKKLDNKLSGKIDGIENKLDGVEKRLTKRIDMLGNQLAVLDDDAPSGEDFDELKAKVNLIGRKFAISV